MNQLRLWGLLFVIYLLAGWLILWSAGLFDFAMGFGITYGPALAPVTKCVNKIIPKPRVTTTAPAMTQPATQPLNELSPVAKFILHRVAELIFVGSNALIMTIAAWLFLRPGKSWIMRLNETGKPMKSSLAVAAIGFTLLTTGLGATFLEIINKYDTWYARNEHFTTMVLLAMYAVIWSAWAILFWLYGNQGSRFQQLSHRIRQLLAGSVILLLAAIPTQIFSPRRQMCYCALGSYIGLVLATAALLWCFGPGIVLLYLHYKQRRQQINARGRMS